MVHDKFYCLVDSCRSKNDEINKLSILAIKRQRFEHQEVKAIHIWHDISHQYRFLLSRQIMNCRIFQEDKNKSIFFKND